MNDFVAYHSTEKMGHDFAPTENFHFFSRKPESFLRTAIGARVWTITGTADTTGHIVFRLAGVFTPSQVRQDGDRFGVVGHGTPFLPAIEISSEEWFAELLNEQNNFSFGFNRIRSENVVAALERAKKRYEQWTAEQGGSPETAAGDEAAERFLEAAVHRMNDEQYGTIADYLRAFEVVLAEGISENHLVLLRAHLAAPEHTTTWAKMAEAVGYPNRNSVNLQYGRFAERIARELGLSENPLDDNGTAWWLWVLVRWADHRDPDSGHTAFVLRRPVVEALQRLDLVGTVVAKGDEQRVTGEEAIGSGAFPEGAVRRITVNAYERNPEARRICLKHYGAQCTVCGMRFAETYGSVAEDFIHVHHLRQLSSVGSEYQIDAVADLRPVCPNCHSVIHLRTPPYSIEEVRSMISEIGQVEQGCYTGPEPRR